MPFIEQVPSPSPPPQQRKYPTIWLRQPVPPPQHRTRIWHSFQNLHSVSQLLELMLNLLVEWPRLCNVWWKLLSSPTYPLAKRWPRENEEVNQQPNCQNKHTRPNPDEQHQTPAPQPESKRTGSAHHRHLRAPWHCGGTPIFISTLNLDIAQPGPPSHPYTTPNPIRPRTQEEAEARRNMPKM